MEREQDRDALREIWRLLACMLMYARRAAGDACDDTERAQLQKEFDQLRNQLDQAADQYHGGISDE